MQCGTHHVAAMRRAMSQRARTMAGRIRVAGVVLLILAATAQASAAGRRVALVIAVSASRTMPRQNAVRDAEAVGGMLRTAGFASVVTLRDPTLPDLRRALADLAAAARDADIAVAFYAGDGVETGGTAYLVPAGATLARRDDLAAVALPLDAVVAATAPARRLGLVLFDASRTDPFPGQPSRRPATRVPAPESRDGTQTSGGAQTGGDTLVAYATGPNAAALDGTGPHSPFTAALLQHLATPRLDLRLAFMRVRDAVLQATGRRQEPYLYGSLGGEVVSLVP